MLIILTLNFDHFIISCQCHNFFVRSWLSNSLGLNIFKGKYELPAMKTYLTLLKSSCIKFLVQEWDTHTTRLVNKPNYKLAMR